MPLAPTAPWIVPPDYTGAMARGAQLGLSARNQDREEKSAADRLKLAYDQLDRHEKIASANAAEKLAFETKKLDLMGEYNKQRLEAQAAKNTPAAAEGLITQEKDGKTYQLRGGKWYHIPSVNPLMDTVTETTPAQDAVPAVPAIPAKTHWFLPNEPAIPAVPGTPARGKITRTHKVPSGLPMGTSSADNTDAAAALTAQAAPGMALPQGPGIPPGPFQTPAQNIPDAPIDKSQRKIGQVYKTPKGLHQWTEAGWIKQTSSNSNEER